jgi:hypothetical protein
MRTSIEVRTIEAVQKQKLGALLLQQYMDMAVASTPGEERTTLQVFGVR